MSDGRCFTSYISNCQMNDNIRLRNAIKNDQQYRTFLQTQAKTLMAAQSDICFTDDHKLCALNCADNTSLNIK